MRLGVVGRVTAPPQSWESHPPPTLTQVCPGFMQVSGDTRLVAVQGPVPDPPACGAGALELPKAFTAPATHLKPVGLAPDAGAAR